MQGQINDYQKIVQNNWETIVVSATVLGAYCTYKYTNKYYDGDPNNVVPATMFSTMLSGPLVFGALYFLPHAIPGISVIALVKWWKGGF